MYVWYDLYTCWTPSPCRFEDSCVNWKNVCGRNDLFPANVDPPVGFYFEITHVDFALDRGRVKYSGPT